MARVILWGSLKPLAGGRTEFDIEAASIRDVLVRLGEDHPGLKPRLDQGVSVSVDGVIYREAWFAPVGPDSEVHILPRLAGG